MFLHQIGAVCEYVKMLLENQGLKFLVFAHHKEMMTALAQTVMAYQRDHKTKFKYIRIDGSVPSLERAVSVYGCYLVSGIHNHNTKYSNIKLKLDLKSSDLLAKDLLIKSYF